MTGEDCSQPPDGVADTMLPALIDDVEMHGVAAHLAARRPTVGSPAPDAADRAARRAVRRARSFDHARRSPRPMPGRSSSEASSPTSLRRSSL